MTPSYPAGPLNFSLGAGGLGMFMGNNASADSGLAFDTKGHICVYSNICHGFGWQSPVAGSLSGVVGVGHGKLCSGESDTSGPIWTGGEGIISEGTVQTGPDGTSFARGFFGVGGQATPAGVGYQSCHTTLICR